MITDMKHQAYISDVIISKNEEKYRIIHDKLAKNIQYDYAVLNASPMSKDYYTSRNLENGLLNGTCVCVPIRIHHNHYPILVIVRAYLFCILATFSE